MIHTIDSIAFNNLDERLLDYLREKTRINKTNTKVNINKNGTTKLYKLFVFINSTGDNLVLIFILNLIF